VRERLWRLRCVAESDRPCRQLGRRRQLAHTSGLAGAARAWTCDMAASKAAPLSEPSWRIGFSGVSEIRVPLY
jgi:hypothetical protein